MDKIKIQVLGPVGDVLHEIETKYSADQLDRFLSQNRIVVISDEEPVHFVSDKHRWSPNTDKNDKKVIYSKCKEEVLRLKVKLKLPIDDDTVDDIAISSFEDSIKYFSDNGIEVTENIIRIIVSRAMFKNDKVKI